MSTTAFALAASFFAAPTPTTRRWPTPNVMAMQLEPRSVRTSDALKLINEAVVDLCDGPTDRLMIFCPPQEGKSQTVSRWTPLWLLANDPTLRIAIVSFEARKAERWGKQTLRDIRTHPELGIELAKDSQSSGKWETVQGGGLICVGIEGGITGEPVDVLIVDDPVRGRAEAESLTYRENAWDWWESNGSTRLSERGKVIVMMTRWHQDDLAGRLQSKEPGAWKVLSIPAIATQIPDPLGRAVGEEMVSVRGRKPGYFHGLKALRSGYVFNSIYQQSPVQAEGGLFPRTLLNRFWREAPPTNASGMFIEMQGLRTFALADAYTFITMDTAAATKEQNDWSVASVWCSTNDGQLVLLDLARQRFAEEQHIDLVLPLVNKWRPAYVGIENVHKTMTLAHALGANGVAVKRLEHRGLDKVTRAQAAADLVKQGRLWLPADAWFLDGFLDEVCAFPAARFDDQVDTLSYAALEALGTVAAPVFAEHRVASDVDDLYASDDAPNWSVETF